MFATMPEVRSVAIEGSGDVAAEGVIVAGAAPSIVGMREVYLFD